jgi:hypothetical protein
VSKFTPRGLSSPLVSKFTPRGLSSPLWTNCCWKRASALSAFAWNYNLCIEGFKNCNFI